MEENNNKLTQAKARMNLNLADMQHIKERTEERQHKADARRREIEESETKQRQMRSEREKLRKQDCERVLARLKWQEQQRKMRIVEKHSKIQSSLDKHKATLAYQENSARVFNSLQKQTEYSQSKMGGYRASI